GAEEDPPSVERGAVPEGFVGAVAAARGAGRDAVRRPTGALVHVLARVGVATGAGDQRFGRLEEDAQAVLRGTREDSVEWAVAARRADGQVRGGAARAVIDVALRVHVGCDEDRFGGVEEDVIAARRGAVEEGVESAVAGRRDLRGRAPRSLVDVVAGERGPAATSVAVGDEQRLDGLEPHPRAVGRVPRIGGGKRAVATRGPGRDACETAEP